MKKAEKEKSWLFQEVGDNVQMKKQSNMLKIMNLIMCQGR